MAITYNTCGYANDDFMQDKITCRHINAARGSVRVEREEIKRALREESGEEGFKVKTVEGAEITITMSRHELEKLTKNGFKNS